MNENARKAAMYAELYNPKTPVVHVDLFAELKKELAEARAEIENLHWRVSDEQAKTRAALELNSKALELVNEARARIDHLKSIIDEMTEEQASLCAEGQSITELVAAKDKLIEQMREARRLALARAGGRKE
jgi:two-component sensor histidine kinase